MPLEVNGPLLQMKKIYIAALILTLGGLSEAAAQSSFIVRLEATAASEMIEALEQGTASKQGPYAALFDQVTAVQPVVRESEAGKNAALPFRAYTLSAPDSVQMARLLAAWAAQPGVAYTQRNHLYRLDGFESLVLCQASMCRSCHPDDQRKEGSPTLLDVSPSGIPHCVRDDTRYVLGSAHGVAGGQCCVHGKA